jgi:hypothetical protein
MLCGGTIRGSFDDGEWFKCTMIATMELLLNLTELYLVDLLLCSYACLVTIIFVIICIVKQMLVDTCIFIGLFDFVKVR